MSGTTVNSVMVEDLLRPVLLKDLRIQLRARQLNPGGNREVLAERLKEHMLATGDVTMFADGQSYVAGSAPAEVSLPVSDNSGPEALKNNYVRPEGQNVGNFITDRPSSRVLAPPGGGSSITFG